MVATAIRGHCTLQMWLAWLVWAEEPVSLFYQMLINLELIYAAAWLEQPWDGMAGWALPHLAPWLQALVT